jgi:pyrimidine-specific ribonucleoside hydrolase
VTTRLIIDCDPGIDDAIAILLALASPELDLRALTTVAGNVGLDLTTANGLRVLELAGRSDVPLAAGCERPLIRHDAVDAADVHAIDGLGGVDLPPPSTRPVGEHAIDLIARVVAEAPTVVVAVGPLTNIALLLARHPHVAALIPRLVIMGGSAIGGNATAAAEFNVWGDPEAAARVFESGIPIAVVGLDVTQRAILFAEEVDRIATSGPIGAAAAAMLRHYLDFAVTQGRRGVAMHDPLAVAELLGEPFCTYAEARVAVDYGSALSRGATLVDRRSDAPNARWAVTVDRDRFAAMLIERLASLDGNDLA